LLPGFSGSASVQKQPYFVFFCFGSVFASAPPLARLVTVHVLFSQYSEYFFVRRALISFSAFRFVSFFALPLFSFVYA